MAKYTQDVKDKCVEAAKSGMHLKAIQQEFGPNPKAVMRYLAKAGIDYKELITELKANGKGPQTPVQKAKQKQKQKANQRKNVAPKTQVIEE